MRFASLGSGSRGNALIVDAGGTRILLDCGFSTRVALERLARLGVEPESLAAVLVTHEHGDHAPGAFRFSRRYGIPVYLTHGTRLATVSVQGDCSGCVPIDSHEVFSIGDLEVRAFPVPHDAREPVQFVFSDGARRLGVLTDTGSITQHIIEMLGVCDALVLECNHDIDMLSDSPYPMSLKRRISGSLGHLANDQAASLLRKIKTQQLQHIIAAHLSEQNNRPELAVAALASALNCRENLIDVASQENGFGWRQLM